ncbi:unnamed protein product [Symbiodinium sp. CCMP2592]|nr:unnamed protein product [Symbiodinium sp. CCMP2592]
MVFQLRGVQEAIPGNAVFLDAEDASRNDQNRRGSTPSFRRQRWLADSRWNPRAASTAMCPHRGMEDASDDIPDTKVGQWPKWTATGAPTQKGTALRVEKNAWETQRLCINQSAGSRAETTEANKVDGRGRFRTRRRFPNGRGAARSLIQPRSSSINAAAGGKGHRKSFVGAIRFRCRGGPSSWTSRRCSTTGRRQCERHGTKRAQHRGRPAVGLLCNKLGSILRIARSIYIYTHSRMLRRQELNVT